MPLISLSGVIKRFGPDLVLDNVSFRLERGDHVALVGPNGAGKSTLLRITAGLQAPDSGVVARSRGARIAYMPQDPDLGGAETLYEAMLDVFHPVMEAHERLHALESAVAAEDPTAIEEYGRLQQVVEHAGYDFRAQIERVLTGLNLGRDLWHAPLESLSGGQRTRAGLARTLLEEADLLLLDEPTNHLDIPSLEWLEGYLRALRRAFVLVAHDRYLLERVTTRTLDLSFGRVTVYDASYERYLGQRAERAERHRADYAAQQRQIEKTEEFVRRYAAGQRSKEARGRQKRLDRLARVERPEDHAALHLGLERVERSGDLVLVTSHLVAGYDQALVRLPESVILRRGERVAVIGPNGAGKSTLLRTLLDQIRPLSGTITWGAQTSIAYYSQTLGDLGEERTILEEVTRDHPMSEEEARSYLARFLFRGDDVFKTVGVLSGGERSRVALARLMLQNPNVLILDEPTNHLDIASRDALQALLQEFRGTLLFVSHDRALIDAVAREVWVVEDGTLRRYAGTYSQYAAGTARALDLAPTMARRATRTNPEDRLRALSEEACALAARLSQAGATASLAQLTELTERFAEVQAALQEAQDIWLLTIGSSRSSWG